LGLCSIQASSSFSSGDGADAKRAEKVSCWSVCSTASDAAVERSQAAGETDKQAEPQQGEQGEDGWARVRGCRCADGEALVLELACGFGAAFAEDRDSFSAVGQIPRRVALFRAASITHQGPRAVFVCRAGAVSRPIRARGILASRPAVAAGLAAARFAAGLTFFASGAGFFASGAGFFASGAGFFASGAAFFASGAAFFASGAAFFATWIAVLATWIAVLASWIAFLVSLGRLLSFFGRLLRLFYRLLRLFDRLLHVGEWRRGELRNRGRAGRRKSDCKEKKEDPKPHPR
jgi:hypothetical protein